MRQYSVRESKEGSKEIICNNGGNNRLVCVCYNGTDTDSMLRSFNNIRNINEQKKEAV
jgi:hypothetical protein